MKTNHVYFVLSCLLLLACQVAFGQEAVTIVPTEAAPPEWLSEFIVFLSGIPKVGPIIIEVGKWVGLIATAFTALSVMATTLLKIPELAARWVGATDLAMKIEKLNEKIQPYLKWASVFNAKPPKK